MFSATMTEEVAVLIEDFFVVPETIAIALSGTPLANIEQVCYPVKNYYTKVNLLIHLLRDKDVFNKVLVFAANKKSADRLFELLEEDFMSDVAIIHSNKSQNYRIRSVEQFATGEKRIIVATDVMARGLDLEKISHVINLDVPTYPENYMHRIGRTGRAEEQGNSILLYTEKEEELKEGIEGLMDYKIPVVDFPEEVEESDQLAPEERDRPKEINRGKYLSDADRLNSGFHEKKEKNNKENQGGSYRREIAKKYKKPKTRGDKNFGRRRKPKK